MFFFCGCGVLAFDLTFFIFCIFKYASMRLFIELFVIVWRILLFHAIYGTVDAYSEIVEIMKLMNLKSNEMGLRLFCG